MSTDAFSEVAGGDFLTLGLVHVALACLKENPLLFRLDRKGSSQAKSRDGRAGDRDAAADGYSMDNPTSAL